MQDLSTPRTALLANAVAAAVVTDLTVASVTLGPQTTVGQVWKLTGLGTFLHTAATTPTLTLELAVAGVAVVAAVATPVAVAGTFSFKVEAYFTVRAIGVSGSIMGAIQLQSQGLTLSNAAGGANLTDTTADTIDLTSNKVVSLRVRMTTAVASNTLTVSQGWPERLVA